MIVGYESGGGETTNGQYLGVILKTGIPCQYQKRQQGESVMKGKAS
jgi:hypothetical protein